LKENIKNGTYKKKNLLPGRYNLKVIADQEEYYPLQKEIYVVPGFTNIKSFTLKEKPAKWYKSWWFWTITGVVVTGATATTIYLMNDNPKGLGDVYSH